MDMNVLLDSKITPPSTLEIPVPCSMSTVDATCFLKKPEGTLEIDAGCGKGRFLLARAAAHPQTGFIGIERQRRRVDAIIRKAARAKLQNIRLLHTDIRFALEMMIPDQKVRTLYLFFPDPWPKRRHHLRRLMTLDFLKCVHRKLITGGCFHFATDHEEYAENVCNICATCPGFSPCPAFIPAPQEQTDFEILFASQGTSAYRCSLQKKECGNE